MCAFFIFFAPSVCVCVLVTSEPPRLVVVGGCKNQVTKFCEVHPVRFLSLADNSVIRATTRWY